MTDEAEELRHALEAQHRGIASFTQTVPVSERYQDQIVCDGIAHVFDIEGHANATRAYAWSSPVEGSPEHRFFAVLQMGAIWSPLDAVRAVIVAEQKGLSR